MIGRLIKFKPYENGCFDIGIVIEEHFYHMVIYWLRRKEKSNLDITDLIQWSRAYEFVKENENVI